MNYDAKQAEHLPHCPMFGKGKQGTGKFDFLAGIDELRKEVLGV